MMLLAVSYYINHSPAHFFPFSSALRQRIIHVVEIFQAIFVLVAQSESSKKLLVLINPRKGGERWQLLLTQSFA